MVGFLRGRVWNRRCGAERSFSAVTTKEKLKEQKRISCLERYCLVSQCVRIKLKGVLV